MMAADFSIGAHEIEAMISVLFGVSSFLIALWMKDIKKDVHDLVLKVGEHSERIARLEARVDALEGK